MGNAQEFVNRFVPGSVGQAILVLSAVVALGVGLGSLRYRKLGLGSAGVLFAGIFFGQLGFRIDPAILDFARDFGLLLFVYSIGLQVGPSFFSSLRGRGLGLNLLAGFIVTLGTLTALALRYLLNLSAPAAAGLLAGATTNTPSLAAAQTVLEATPLGQNDYLGMGYAVAYPFGIAGIITVILLTRAVFRSRSGVITGATLDAGRPTAMDFEVRNVNLAGRTLAEIPFLAHEGVVVSRVRRGKEVFVPTGTTALALHDRIRLVGQVQRLPEFEALIGPRAKPDAPQAPSPVTTKRLYVTKAAVVGRTLAELALETTHGAVATRVTRSGVEFTAREDTCLHVGDLLLVVGPQEALEAVARLVGNEPKALDHPPLLALFAGIFCGVALGAVPIFLPGLPAPVRLGLAGGPLIVALVASQLGRVGPLNWYLTPGANFVLREFGIAMFLACVGLKSGHGFLATVLSARGVLWAAGGILITVVPLLAGTLLGRKAFRLDDATLSGVLAGSMTDPPALAFASSLSESEEPLVAYAAVYPLTMVLRVFFAQVLVLLTLG